MNDTRYIYKVYLQYRSEWSYVLVVSGMIFNKYCNEIMCNQNMIVSKNVWSALLANSFGTSGIFDFSRYALYAK